MAEVEEEVLMEVEALQSVYGDDCVVLHRFPPHLNIHINPRTAQVHSQQFVEATIEIRASVQYPSDPPYVGIIGSKGLDEKRQRHLTARLHDKACELASYMMLVALCEEAAETVTSMNHPEGDCPLCLYPLVADGDHNKSLPFMKLMSCFHCFHCECIIRWLKWIRNQNEANSGAPGVMSSVIGIETQQASDICEMMGDDSTGSCPVCRKIFLAKDIEHLLDSVDSCDVETDADANGDEKEAMKEEVYLLECDLVKKGRERFEAILEVQQQRGGLIEPSKDNVVFSRICIDQELESQMGAAANGSSGGEHQNGPQHAREEAAKSNNQGQGQSAGGSSSGSRRDQRQRHLGRGRGRGRTQGMQMQWSRKDRNDFYL